MSRSTLSSRNRPSLLLVKSTDATGDFLSKKLFVKISQYSQENTCAKSLLNKVAGHKLCNFIKKKTPTRIFFYKYWEISKNTCFEEYLRTAGSEETLGSDFLSGESL